jgi:ABC-type lipoprotein export system ATPase subunit
MSTTTAPKIATKTSVVQARNVNKLFKREAFEVKALDDVSSEIGAREFLALAEAASGGQELAWRWAIVSDPTLLLAEKPIEDLDSASATEILEIRKRLTREKTVEIAELAVELCTGIMYSALVRRSRFSSWT